MTQRGGLGFCLLAAVLILAVCAALFIINPS